MSTYYAPGPEGMGAYEIEWTAKGPVFQKVIEVPEMLAIPGFVDMHIHGAHGIDFMDASPEEFGILCRGLASEGYESFLATTITAGAVNVLKAISLLTDDPIVGGFHLEGPFISPARPGAQPPEAIEDAPSGASDWDAVLNDPRLKVVTLAPERPFALELTTRLIQRGVIVNMGHTDATFEQARRGYEFGARGMTHMFNAMREFHHREPGAVGYGLWNDDIYTELIYDRLHVTKDAAAVLLKIKGPEHVIAVSDGTKAIGRPPGEHLDLWGHPAVVGRGEVRLAEGGALAGSAITLRDAFENLAEDFGYDIAIQCCCLTPRKALGMTGSPRVWVEMDRRYKIREIRTVTDRQK